MADSTLGVADPTELQSYTLEDLVPDLQYGLTALSVHNWGSFSGGWSAPIDPQGTLICGDTGAGKSTLVDSMQVLLLKPTQTRFNTAASSEDAKDRSLVTYVRGAYDSERDGARTIPKMMRTGATYSGVSARYAGTDGTDVTLMALFWIAGPGMAQSDVKRLYVLARRKLELPEVLEAGVSNSAGIDRSWLEARYGNDTSVQFFQKWDDYEAAYHTALGLENPKAPALIVKAMGLKEVRDLTALIRDFVLEPGEAAAVAIDAVQEFRELQGIYQEMAVAEQQEAKLAPLEGYKERIEALQDRLDALTAQLGAVPAYVSGQALELVRGRLAKLRDDLQRQKGIVADAKAEVDALEVRAEEAQSTYLLSGGNDIAELEGKIARLDEQIGGASAAAKDCMSQAAGLGVELAGDGLTKEAFTEIRARAAAIATDADALRQQAADEFGDKYAKSQNLAEQKASVDEELAQIVGKGRTSNIPEAFQSIRDQLVGAFALDPETLVFLGEMVQVKPQDAPLRGAIERALGKSRLDLLVPESAVGSINGWVNARHLGVDFRFHGVREDVAPNRDFKRDGYMRLLDWRDHPYREAAKRQLISYDKSIKATPQEVAETANAMTAEGLMSYRAGTYDKRDSKRIDDEDNWYTGHNGAVRRDLLARRSCGLDEALKSANSDRDAAHRAQTAIGHRIQIMQVLSELTWDRVDAGSLIAQKRERQSDIDYLKNNDVDLAAAKAAVDTAKQELRANREVLQDSRSAQTRIESAIEQDEGREARFAETAGSEPIDAEIAEALRAHEMDVTWEKLEDAGGVERRLRDAVAAESQGESDKLSDASVAACRVMATYKEKWPAHAGDLGDNLASMEGYLGLLEEIRRDRLPKIKDRFTEKLNHNALQSLEAVRASIEQQQEDIEQRIDDVNHVLCRVEFEPGTRLNVIPTAQRFVEVDDFEAKVDAVRAVSLSEDPKKRYAALEVAMNHLATFTDPSRLSNLGSLRLLDARYRMEFSSNKTDIQTGEVLSSRGSTGGLSGGQRESFSSFIVAASLAYALTPAGGKAPRMSTVFLDEAFSRTSTAMIKPVIAVFRALRLHMNLLTPYKELDTSEQATRAVVLVEMNDRTKTSSLKHITWEKFLEVRHGKGIERLPDGEVRWRKEGGADEAAG